MATGYMLGRTKKMKLALMIGSWAAGQKFGSPAELLSKGTDLLRKSPEFAQLNDEVRVKLIDAGKAAVAAAAAQRLTKLTDTVGSSAERVAAGGPLRVARPDEDDGDKPRRSLLRFRRRDAEPAEVDEVDEVEETEDEDLPDAEGDEDAASSDGEADAEETSAESEQDEDEQPAPRRRRAPARQAAEKAPAKRASSGGSGGRTRTSRTPSGGKTAAAAKRTATAAAKPAARSSRAAAGRRGAE
jgi:hypothetical protein